MSAVTKTVCGIGILVSALVMMACPVAQAAEDQIVETEVSVLGVPAVGQECVVEWRGTPSITPTAATLLCRVLHDQQKPVAASTVLDLQSGSVTTYSFSWVVSSPGRHEVHLILLLSTPEGDVAQEDVVMVDVPSQIGRKAVASAPQSVSYGTYAVDGSAVAKINAVTAAATAVPFAVPTDTWGQANPDYCSMDGAINKIICWMPSTLLWPAAKGGSCWGIETLNLRWYVLQRNYTFLPRLRDFYNTAPSGLQSYTAGVVQNLTALENALGTVANQIENGLLQPSGVCAAMKTAIGGGAPGLVIMRLTYVDWRDGQTKNAGHALTAFAYQETASEVQFSLADPNYPNTVTTLTFAKSTSVWSYPTESTWSNLKIGFLPLSYFGTAPASAKTADLNLSGFGNFSPSTIAPGAHPTAVQFSVKNIGPTALASPNTRMLADFFLSSNSTFGDSDDVKIGDISFDLSMTAGQTLDLAVSQSGLQYIQVPQLMATGQYYVFARVRHCLPSELIDTAPYNDQLVYATRLTVQAPPSSPTGVSATDGTYSDKVRVTWSASSGATGYEVWRGTSSSSSSAAKIGDATSTTYDDTGATAGTTYYYWVKAKNSAGTSGFSSSNTGYRSVAIAPVPTGVSATDGTYSDKVRVTWSASNGATGYEVWRGTSSSSSSASKIGDATSTTYDDTVATAGTTYYYWVKAKNSAGTSVFSSADTGYRLAIPAAPTGVSATDGTCSDKVRVTWSASSGATGYEVWRGTSSSSSSASKIGSPTSTTYDDTGATAGTTYYYWVKAKNSAGTSGFSSSNTGYRKK